MANAYPYLLLLVAFGFLAVANQYFAGASIAGAKGKRTATCIVALLLFVFFFGFRGFVAYDWTAYTETFANLPDLPSFFHADNSRFKTEPGFLLLVATCKTLVPNYLFFQIVCTLINTTLLTLFIRRYTQNLPAVLVLYITMSGLDFSIDLMRNSLSIFIFLNAIPLIEKRRLVPYLLVCLLAATFHTSALAYLPMYFVLGRRWNKKLMAVVLLAVNIVCVFRLPIVKTLATMAAGLLSPTAAQYIDTYISYQAQGSSIGIGYAEKLFTGVMLLCYIDKLRALRGTNVLVNSLFLYLTINLSLSEFRTISVRCSNLFVFAYWIVWLDLAKCLYYKSNKILYVIFISLYCLLKTYSGCSGSMSQYYNVLLENSDGGHNARFIYFRQHQNDKN